MMKKVFSIVAALCVSLYAAAVVQADEKPEIKACRSVHLFYPAPDSIAFYNEVTVEKSEPGTYFMVNGFNMGYFGIQELYDGKKVILFSVWDPGQQDDPDSVKEEQRVKLLYKADDVRVARFGNEGTGGQSFLDYDWKVGETYRFCVSAIVNGKRTEYTGWFYKPEDKAWKKLVTFSTITGGKYMNGFYSFIEDFLRNGTSAKLIRRANYGNGWVMDKDGHWYSLTKAQFTADNNPVVNIDAGVKDQRFFLQTGGMTQNKTTELYKHIEREPQGLDFPNFPKSSAEVYRKIEVK